MHSRRRVLSARDPNQKGAMALPFGTGSTSRSTEKFLAGLAAFIVDESWL